MVYHLNSMRKILSPSSGKKECTRVLAQQHHQNQLVKAPDAIARISPNTNKTYEELLFYNTLLE